MSDKLDITNSTSFDITAILNKLITNRFRIILVTFLITLSIVGISYLVSEKYTSRATLLPSGDEKDLLGQYASIASLVGINIGSGGGSTEKLYPEIVTSVRILSTLNEKKWKHSSFDSLVTLSDIFKIEPSKKSRDPELEIKQLTIDYLRKNVIAITVDKKTGFIEMTVTADDPLFAADFLKSLLAELEVFNKKYRKSKSNEEKLFLEKRLNEVSDEMAEAENSLKNFEENSRNFAQSPELKLKWQRLSRNVQVATTMWIELKKQYEITKLSVEREKLTLNVLDAPEPPAKKDSPIRILWLISGMILGTVCSCAYYGFKNEVNQYIKFGFEFYKSAKILKG